MCGIADDRIQRRLFAEKNLTFTRAYEIAEAMETASRNTTDIQGTSHGSVNRIDHSRSSPVQQGPDHSSHGAGGARSKWRDADKQGKQQYKSCYRCNNYTNDGHREFKCPFTDAVCHACGIKGHIRPACLSRSQHSSPRNNVPSAKTLNQKYSTNYVENNNNSTVTCDFDSDSHSDHIPGSEAYSMFKMSPEFFDTDPVTIMVTMEDSLVQVEIDTGASVSLISQQTYDTLWSNKNNKPDLEEFTDVFKTYTGEAVFALGKLKADVSTFKLMVHCTYSTYMIMAVQSLYTLPVNLKCISETD